MFYDNLEVVVVVVIFFVYVVGIFNMLSKIIIGDFIKVYFDFKKEGEKEVE